MLLQNFQDSILELRRRVILSILFFISTFFIVLFFNKILIENGLNFVVKAIQNKQEIRIFTQNISSAFIFRMKITLYLSFAISLPYFLFQLYSFISLGLFKKERKVLFYTSTIGIIFGYFGFIISILYLVPLCISFFLSMQFNQDVISQFIELNSLLSLIFNIGTCGFIIFQTPIIVFLLLMYNFLQLKSFSKFRLYSIPVYLTISGIITPPDVLSQVICTIIMLGLTEIGFVCFLLYNAMIKNKNDYSKQNIVYQQQDFVEIKKNKKVKYKNDYKSKKILDDFFYFKSLKQKKNKKNNKFRNKY